MIVAIIVVVIAIALVAGALMAFRNSATTGLPSKEVIDRVAARESAIEAHDEAERQRQGN